MTGWSAKELWEAALGELQIQVTRPNYETWLKGTVGLEYEGGKFTLGAPSPFAAEWLHKRMRPLIEKTLAGIVKTPLEIEIRVHQGREGQSRSYSNHDEGVSTNQPSYELPEQGQLNPKYTFENFIVGSSNMLAHAAAAGVSAEPGLKYNPLFIYAGAGLGKTHLLHAIGNKARKENLTVLYVSAEHFTNDLIVSIRERKTEGFRNKYRGVDILLVDDIQFIRGKEQTQESFFHTFNDLQNNNKQIVITSDQHPKSMVNLEERLISRFEGGLLADIQPPDLETRLAILRAKAELVNMAIQAEALIYLAKKVQTNIRELEGTLNRVVAYSRLTRKNVDMEVVTQALASLPSKPKRTIIPSLVMEKVTEYFNIGETEIKGKSRRKSIALARHIAMYLLREEARQQFTLIGAELGDRDHTTVLHGYQKIANDMEKDPQLKRDIMEIRDLLYNKVSS